MKSFLPLWGGLGLLFFGPIAWGDTVLDQGADLERFRGIRWGQSVLTIPGPEFELKFKDGPIEYYTRKNDKLTLGPLAIKEISYGFWSGAFLEAKITVGSSAEETMKELEFVFGDDFSTESRDVRWFYTAEDVYTWEKEETRIRLTSPSRRLGRKSEECTFTITSKKVLKKISLHEWSEHPVNE